MFGSGGAAFTNETFQTCNPNVGCAGQSSVVAGWTAGAGVEYAFADNWSALLEYLHVDFGSQSFSRTLLAGGFFDARQVTLTDEIFKAGLNYKFDLETPVVPRYTHSNM